MDYGSQERQEEAMERARIAREAESAALREKAERIARDALDKYAYIPGDRLSYTRAKYVATAAALAALTEKET